MGYGTKLAWYKPCYPIQNLIIRNDVTLRSKETILRERYEFLKSEYIDLFNDLRDSFHRYF